MNVIADVVADWCKLEIGLFRRVYERCTAGTDAYTWSMLVAQAPTTPGMSDAIAELRRGACREALRVAVLGDLALSIAHVQIEIGDCTSVEADQMINMVVNANVGGRMQALVSDGGLLARETLLGTLAVDSATAIVYRGSRVLGTAFLVAPDLVMTAAHVALDSNGTEFLEQLAIGLSFSFRVYEGAASREPVIAYPAAHRPLVASSLPWGKPPNQLLVTPSEHSPIRLDFALIRLDREVRHVSPLNVKSPPRPYQGDSLVVVGFPGGTAMKWHVGSIAKVDSVRLQHRANALPGMSGSCCINVNGNPVALHEGSLTSNSFDIGGGAQNASAVNRAVCLWVIRNAMPTGAADPLVARTRSPALEFQDELMVRRWAKSGLRFAPNAMQLKWKQLVKDIVGSEPEEAGTMASFHPWFTRSDFEAWVDQNNSPSHSIGRLCLVTGGSGTGKSFLASILCKRVNDEVKDVVVISATETTAWSWRDAIEKWGVKPESLSGLRPEAGVAMHDETPKAAMLVADHGNRVRESSQQPLFVFIDFDGNASFSPDEEPPWLPFMSDLLSYPWVRLAVVGAPESIALALTDSLQDQEFEPPRRIRLDHVGADEFRDFARRILRKGRSSVPSAELEEAMRTHTRILEALSAPQLQTAASVMAAIMLRSNLGS